MARVRENERERWENLLKCLFFIFNIRASEHELQINLAASLFNDQLQF